MSWLASVHQSLAEGEAAPVVVERVSQELYCQRWQGKSRWRPASLIGSTPAQPGSWSTQPRHPSRQRRPKRPLPPYRNEAPSDGDPETSSSVASVSRSVLFDAEPGIEKVGACLLVYSPAGVAHLEADCLGVVRGADCKQLLPDVTICKNWCDGDGDRSAPPPRRHCHRPCPSPWRRLGQDNQERATGVGVAHGQFPAKHGNEPVGDRQAKSPRAVHRPIGFTAETGIEHVG